MISDKQVEAAWAVIRSCGEPEANAAFIAAASPKTVLELIRMVRKGGSAV